MLTDKKTNDRSPAYGIYLMVGSKINITSYFGFLASVGYSIELNSDFLDIRADWTGLRANAGVFFTIPNKKIASKNPVM